jgi:hypothetical protein
VPVCQMTKVGPFCFHQLNEAAATSSAVFRSVVLRRG